MIAYLRGILLERTPNRVVLELNGIGYEVFIPISTYSHLPAHESELAVLFIHTHVREDALQLYGFATRLEMAIFEKLISVSGIGPRLALAILSGLPAEELSSAIRSADHARLTAIPGVGKKTAERVVLELRDKLPLPAEAVPVQHSNAAADALSALMNLGYTRPQAEKAIAHARAEGSGDSFEPLFKACMHWLGA